MTIPCPRTHASQFCIFFFTTRRAFVLNSSFIHSYIHLGRIAEKRGWMLIKATLQTELTKRKKERREKRRDERKMIKRFQWWFLLGNHNHQANPHIHQQHIDWATTFQTGHCSINMLLVKVWICLRIKKISDVHQVWDFKRLLNCETVFGRLK